MGSNLRLDQDGGIAILRLTRPPVNALDAGFLEDIDAALDDVEGAADSKALVVTGDGAALSAGLNLKTLPTLDAQGQRRTVEALNRTFSHLYALPLPVVVAANGHAIAGGLFFVLTADYRVGALGAAQFGLSEIRVGVRFPVGPLEIARAELTPAATRRLLLGGGTVSAEEARAMGVLDELVEPGQLCDRAMAVARGYGEIPPKTFAAVKRQLRDPTLARVDRAIREAADPTLDGWFTDESVEAMHKMLAK